VYKLDVKKFSFSNRVVDKWNSLTDTCVNCITVNNFKDYILKELEPETCTFEYYNVCHQILMASVNSVNLEIIKKLVPYPTINVTNYNPNPTNTGSPS